MSILIVIPFCLADSGLAGKLIDWIGELGGCPGNDCLLVASDKVPKPQLDSVYKRAEVVFRSVTVATPPFSLPNEQWPIGANWMFECTLRHLQAIGNRSPFLWLEPDAVPMHALWLTKIEEEYGRVCETKPFLGQIVLPNDKTLPGRMLSGVAVYPANAHEFYLREIQVRRKVAWDVLLADKVLPYAQHSLLFWNFYGQIKQPPTFSHSRSPDSPPNTITLGQIPKCAALVHRSKDGRLIDVLRSARRSAEVQAESTAPVEVSASLGDITVVITNYNRPDKVRKAFDSCVRAGVPNIVISSSGCGAPLKAAHKQILERRPETVIDAIDGDLGCNEMWLRGVKMAKTKWVHLLHDDDMLTPDFGSLGGYLNNGACFYHWNGSKHAWPERLLEGCNKFQTWFPNLKDGIHESDVFWPVLLGDKNWSISPVSGLFTRDHLLSTLSEFERDYRGSEFFFKPRMQAGNDLLIWLKAVEEFGPFCFISKPLVSYGHWQGSASYSDYGRKLGLLSSIYDATRDRFLRGPDFDMLASRPLVHVQSVYNNPKDRDRIRFAGSKWEDQYRRGQWRCEAVDDSHLNRMFEDGPRRLPYLKDIVATAISRSTESDPIFVLTNTDTIPVQSLTRHLHRAFADHPCAYSFRRDVPTQTALDEETIRTHARYYSGCDLFAFTREWWEKNSPDFPDMLYATDAWDYCLHQFMDARGGKRFYHLIYHSDHQGEWDRNKGSAAHAYNHAQAEPFLRGLGIEPYWLWKKPPRFLSHGRIET